MCLLLSAAFLDDFGDLLSSFNQPVVDLGFQVQDFMSVEFVSLLWQHTKDIEIDGDANQLKLLRHTTRGGCPRQILSSSEHDQVTTLAL